MSGWNQEERNLFAVASCEPTPDEAGSRSEKIGMSNTTILSRSQRSNSDGEDANTNTIISVQANTADSDIINTVDMLMTDWDAAAAAEACSATETVQKGQKWVPIKPGGSKGPSPTELRDLDDSIFKLYGSLLGFSDQQKRRVFSGTTEDRVEVSNIYLGIYRFGATTSGDSSGGSGSGDMPLYIRVDGSNNQFILLGLKDKERGNSGEKEGIQGTEEALVQIEELPFDQIKKIMCGPVRHGNSLCFIAFSVTPNLALNSCGVGPNCMLCPTLTDSTINSAKFVLVLLDKKALEVFRAQMDKQPYTHMMQKKTAAWLQCESRWPEVSLKGCMFAHVHRNAHTIDELRDRAARELGAKEEVARAAKRARTESSAPSPASTATTTTAAATTATTATSSTALLSSPPPLSSTQEYAVWQAKRDKDIAEIKNTLRDKELCALLSASEIDLLKNSLVQLMLQ